MSITVSDTNCNFLFTVFESNNYYNVFGRLPTKSYNSHADVVNALITVLNNTTNITIVNNSGNTVASNRNYKWSFTQSGRWWYIKCNFNFTPRCIFNGIQNLGTFASIPFTRFSNNQAARFTDLLFTQPYFTYFTLWKYNYIYVKINGKWYSISVYPGGQISENLKNWINGLQLSTPKQHASFLGYQSVYSRIVINDIEDLIMSEDIAFSLGVNPSNIITTTTLTNLIGDMKKVNMNHYRVPLFNKQCIFEFRFTGYASNVIQYTKSSMNIPGIPSPQLSTFTIANYCVCNSNTSMMYKIYQFLNCADNDYTYVIFNNNELRLKNIDNIQISEVKSSHDNNSKDKGANIAFTLQVDNYDKNSGYYIVSVLFDIPPMICYINGEKVGMYDDKCNCRSEDNFNTCNCSGTICESFETNVKNNSVISLVILAGLLLGFICLTKSKN